jgi:hypothetical protein
MAGGVVSATATVKEHVEVFPPPSVAVQVTVVAPSGNVEPDAGTQATVAEPQSSVAVGVWKATTAEHPAALAVTFSGQVIDGAVASRTVTENEQEAVLLAASVAVQVTVVVPTAKVDPEAGAHVTDASPEQEPVADGVW